MTRPPRRIDHLVLAVHDLEDAADVYTRMGFQVGARNRHPWGTENRLIQFRSSFLELITVGDAGQVPPHAHGFTSAMRASVTPCVLPWPSHAYHERASLAGSPGQTRQACEPCRPGGAP